MSKKKPSEIPVAGRLVFGGSFNPVHRGHLAILEHVILERLCERVLIVPAGQSPFKTAEDYADASARMEMLALALEELPTNLRHAIKVSDAEIRRPGPSYTAETLRELEDGIHTGLLIGADSLEFFHNWYEADWILNRVPLYVVCRKGVGVDVVQKWKTRLEGFFPIAKIHLVPFEPPDCSSTGLREMLARGAGYGEVQACLPLAVFSFASGKQVYRKAGDRGPAYT